MPTPPQVQINGIEVRYRPVASLIPHPQNANTHSVKQVGLIAKSIDDNNDRKHYDKPKPNQGKPKPHHQPQPSYQPRVPSVCAISIDSRSGDAVTMYSQKCLRRQGFDYRLPNCARDVRIYGEADRVYSAQCLRDAGFRLGR